MSSQAPLHKAGRSPKAGLKLIQKTGGNLVLASGVTIIMLFGMVLALSLALVFIINSPDPVVGLAIALPITLIFNIAAFFLSPYLMDLTQNWLYNTRWVSLAEIESLSPETAKVIQKVCKQKKLQHPRLGIIDDQNPTAFTYCSFPSGFDITSLKKVKSSSFRSLTSSRILVSGYYLVFGGLT